MRLQVFSDLHVDVAAIKPLRIAKGIDAVVIAGDVCEGIADALTYARGLVPLEIPVILVAGNHEHYGHNLDQELAIARHLAPRHDVHFLENDAVTIGRVRFLGATLWTDFEFWGAEKRADAMALAGATMNDHQRIRRGALDERFTPADARAAHLVSRDFLARSLAVPHPGPTVIVTHHLPHEASVNTRFRASALNVAFASDLSGLIAVGKPSLWVHGHTHASVDARVGATRIVCNPHGYGPENPAFDPCLVIDV